MAAAGPHHGVPAIPLALRNLDRGVPGDLEKSIGDEITEAVRQAEANPPPPIEALFEDVYFDMPPHLQEELEDLKRVRGR